MARVSYKTLATYKADLLIQQIWRGYNVYSTVEPQLLQYFKMVFIEIQNVTTWSVFVNPVTVTSLVNKHLHERDLAVQIKTTNSIFLAS